MGHAGGKPWRICAVTAGVLSLTAWACSLNPQPLPPEQPEDAGLGDASNFGGGGADGGTASADGSPNFGDSGGGANDSGAGDGDGATKVDGSVDAGIDGGDGAADGALDAPAEGG